MISSTIDYSPMHQTVLEKTEETKRKVKFSPSSVCESVSGVFLSYCLVFAW